MLRHVCIEVKNMPVDLVAAFYVEHFGMEAVYQETEKWQLTEGMEVDLRIIKLTFKDENYNGKCPTCGQAPFVLELVQHNQSWPPHLAFQVYNWPKVHLIEPKRIDKPHEGVEVKFCSDPALNMIEVVRRIP